MKEFFVNHIIEQNGVIHGIAVYDKLVLQNLDIAFENDMSKKLLKMIEDKESAYFIHRMGDYVGYLSFKSGEGFTLKLSDFGDNIDTVLDESLDLETKGWEQKDRVRYIEIAHQISKQRLGSKMTDVGLL